MCDGTIWKSLKTKLENKKYNVIIPELKLGKTIKEFTQHTLKLLPEKFIVVGFSMGGFVALNLAIYYPKKVQKLIQKGIDEGAELLIGGTGKPDGLEKGYYAKPTVFANVQNDMAISKEEIFGPVLSMLTYENIDDAVAIANDTEYGLAAYVSGEDKETLTSIARRLRAGQIHVNYGSGGADAPFGGYKQSGNGREKAEWGLEEFLEVKAIMGA